MNVPLFFELVRLVVAGGVVYAALHALTRITGVIRRLK
jgi:hypothetical protein